jgi:hypothetical protein
MSVNLVELNHTIPIPLLFLAVRPVSAASPPASVQVVFYNASTFALTQITVSGVVVSPQAGLPALTPTRPPSSCSSRAVSLLDSQISVAFGTNGWTSTLLVPSVSGTVYIWCMTNGFVLTTGDGEITEISYYIE